MYNFSLTPPTFVNPLCFGFGSAKAKAFESDWIQIHSNVFNLPLVFLTSYLSFSPVTASLWSLRLIETYSWLKNKSGALKICKNNIIVKKISILFLFDSNHQPSGLPIRGLKHLKIRKQKNESGKKFTIYSLGPCRHAQLYTSRMVDI
jgi:hypothetical protein